MSIKYGYYIADCMDKNIGLPKLVEEHYRFNLCLTNPPWNKNYKGTVGGSGNFTRTKIFYDEPIENYKEFCIGWFELLKKLCDTIIIRCGTDNLPMWLEIQKPEDYLWNYKKNGTAGSRIAKNNCIDAYLIYGKINEWWKDNVIDLYSPTGMLHEQVLKHSSPDNTELWMQIIEPIKPESCIDPFAGSGTLGRACLSLGITNFIMYEIDKNYEDDIKKRLNIEIGYRKKPNVKKSKSVLD